MRTIKKYWGLININLQNAIVYRFTVCATFLSDVIKTIVMLSVWNAVYQQKASIVGFDHTMMISYLLISQSLNNIYGFHNAAERVIARKINSGTIGFDFLKPLDFTTARLAENIGQSCIIILYTILLVCVFKVCIPAMIFPKNGLYLILFLLSSGLGFYIMFSISLISGLLSFWTMSSWGLRNTKNAIINFLSGALIPISLMPNYLKVVIDILPFKNIIYTPTLIFMNYYSYKEAMSRIVLQVLWAIVLGIFTRKVYKKMLRKISINGG